MNKSLICLMLVLTALASISCVSASDVNGTVAVENASQIKISDDVAEFKDVVSKDLVVPYHESNVQFNVRGPVLMNQPVGSFKFGAGGFIDDGSSSNGPSFPKSPINTVLYYPILSGDTYNVLADNETSKNVKLSVSGVPTAGKMLTVSAYKDNKLFSSASRFGNEASLDLPMGIYKVFFKYENLNLARDSLYVAVTDGKSLYDLDRIINDGGRDVVLDRNYTYNPLLDTAFKKGVEIGKPVTINGNGHTIDAMYKTRIFDVVSEGVSISNLTMLNGYGKDCGGALLWEANNGVISNVNFTNSFSPRCGGAICLDGKNIILDNLQFVNSTSGWNNDLIYLGHNFKNATFKSFRSDYLNRFIEGRNVNLTPLAAQVNMDVLGCSVDMSKAVFDVMASGGEHVLTVNATSNSPVGKNLNESKTRNITYFGHVVNGTDFLLTFYECIDYVYIIEEFSFVGVANTSRPVGDVVLDKMNDGEFNVSFSYLNYFSVKDSKDYEKAVDLKANKIFGGGMMDYYSQSLKQFGKNRVTCTLGLCVNFIETLNIESHSTWKPKDMGFDSICINGNNSVIDGEAGKRDSRKWADIDEGYIITVSNLTIKKFNNAIINDGGICILQHTTFTKNKMRYWVDRDWGAGILNSGLCICTDCVFTDNYCSCGGAIFNQGTLTINNCFFKDNDAYRKGNTILTVGDATVYLDGKKINGSLDDIGGYGSIKHVDSISTGLQKILKIGSIVLSFAVGVVAGVFTSPAGGAAIGAGVGLVLGSLTSAYINTHNYDMHYNMLKSTLILTGICVLAGAAGGIIGGYAAHFHPSAGPVETVKLQPLVGIETQINGNAKFIGDGFTEIIYETPVITENFFIF